MKRLEELQLFCFYIYIYIYTLFNEKRVYLTKKTINFIFYNTQVTDNQSLGLNTSRDDWIRTSGLVVPNDARYRAALHPALCLP